MKTLSPTKFKVVLIAHFCAFAMWLGGVLSLLPLLWQADVSNFESSYVAYVHMREIAWNVVGWGGIGSLITGLILAMFSHWGLFKHRWIVLKLFLAVGLIVFGMWFNEARIIANVDLMEGLGVEALTDRVFLKNHSALKTGLLVSASGLVTVISIAIVKPWMDAPKQ